MSARRLRISPAALLATIWMLVCAADVALAEPAFAVRTGYRCSQCHVNRSGGGMRTAFGSVYTQTILPARLARWRDEKNLLPADPDARFALGADARFLMRLLESDDTIDTASFETTEANVYGEARLIPGKLSLYLDEIVGPGGASAREVFGLLGLGKWNGYVKAGKFLPAFGWRLPDDAAFIRQFTGFSYSAPDLGLEVGIEPGKWTVHLAAVNGAGGSSDDNRSKQLVLQAIRRFGSARVGISASNNINADVTTSLGGLLAGVNFGRLAILAEADRVELSEATGTRHRLLGYLEADLLISRGLNLKLSHDWIDPDRDLRTDERTRDTVSLEYIPYPFVQLRWSARRLDGPPQIVGANDTQVDFELHVFF